MKIMITKLLAMLMILTTLLTLSMGAFAEEENMIAVDITIGDKVFQAQFFDNETVQAFLDQMPMTLDMSDLHRNEKYHDLPENLPVASTERPDTMHAGEIMLWSGNTIVLFYASFSNSYGGYVRLGYIEDATGLAEAVGTGSVSVTYSISE